MEYKQANKKKSVMKSSRIKEIDKTFHNNHMLSTINSKNKNIIGIDFKTILNCLFNP